MSSGTIGTVERKDRQAGFSLVEIMIALGLFSLVFGALSMAMVKTQESYRAAGQSVGLRQEARIVLSRLSREARYAGYNLKNVSEAFSIAGATELAFAGDIDLGATDGPCTIESGNAGVERVTYRLQDTELQRQVECWDGSAWQPGLAFAVVADGLEPDATVFRYYDADGDELVPTGSTLDSDDRQYVARVEVALDMEDEGRSMFQSSPVRFQVSTQILIRNTLE